MVLGGPGTLFQGGALGASPGDLYQLNRKHSAIGWSEITKRALLDYAGRLDLLDEIASRSDLAESDVEYVNRSNYGTCSGRI